MTLSELELRLGGARGSDSYLAALRAARYGGAGAPTRDQRNAFRRELAAGLGWRGRLRAWWALPPQLRGSAPTWIRTRGLLLRRESLYPAELSGPGQAS